MKKELWIFPRGVTIFLLLDTIIQDKKKLKNKFLNKL